MTLEIISAATCPFAQRSRMVLLEKGLDFDLTEIDLDDKPDWFLKISPYGKVPVLRHDDAVIFESAVVNEYLEEVFPEPALLPSDPVGRAAARIWIDMANTRFVPHVYKVMLAQEAEGQQFHAEKLRDALRLMEEGLAKRKSGDFWMGDTFSLVDITFYPHLERFPAVQHYRGVTLDDFPLVSKWRAMMKQRDSARAVGRPDSVYIANWRKYAENSSTGTTAADMRDGPRARTAAA